jgi:8-oxo-dGTP pyrophosphatase MutT (NUDIX family)
MKEPSKPNPWRDIEAREVYDNPWIHLSEHKVVNPSGGHSMYGKVHFKKYALGIVALDEDMHTWLVGQWRYPLNHYSWEIPMGGGLLEVDRLLSAQRELKEETGITATHWEEVISIHLSNCVSDEVGYGYLARGLSFGETNFDETEDLDILKLPFQEAVEMVMKGEITDSLSVATLLKLDKILS